MLRKLSSTFRVTMAFAFAVLSSGMLQVMPAHAYSMTNPNNEYKKVYVCKYVGTPGVDERLQTGDNPISVSVNSLKNFSGLGTYFNDKHEKSVAIAWDNGDKIEPSIDMCPITPNDVQISVPVVPIIDECGDGNAVYGNVPDGDYTYVRNPDGSITFTANAGFVFPGNLDVVSIAAPIDSGELCNTPVTLVKCETLPQILATNINQSGWSMGAGATFVDGGVQLAVGGGWAESVISRTITGELRELGDVIDYTPNTQYLGLHVQTEQGTLVYEHVYGGNWWLNTATATQAMIDGAPHTGGGQGSPYYGTLQEWANAFPTLKTTSLTVLFTSPVEASAIVTSVKIGCVEYTFDREDVETPLPSGIADVCGVGNDTVPDQNTQYYIVKKDTGWTQDGSDPVKKVRTVTYEANAGYKFPQSAGWTVSQDGKTASYTYTDFGTPCTVICEAKLPLIRATNLNPNGWTLGSGAQFVDGGMKLSSTGNWSESTITRTMSGNLSALGNVIDFLPNQNYLGLHVETSAGTLVYEKYYENQNPANAGKWWSKSDFGVSGGQGYATFDTLDSIIAANPLVTLKSLTVLYTSPVEASSTVTNVQIGCNEYTFDHVDEPTTPVDEPEIPVLGTDTDEPRVAGEELPEVLPQTGVVDSRTQLIAVLLAGLLTYGAMYFTGSRREDIA